jgi:glycosyltransferase involved in cell wall biosynthesis
MSIKNPTITAIICTYRRPQMLRRAIESILNQTYQDFQICIYDNASGDATSEVVNEFARRDSRIKYHCHSENIGILGNYSYAIQQVSTEFFVFLGDDDLILPNFYSVSLAGFAQEPKAFFSATSYLCLSLYGNKVGSGHLASKILYAPDGVFEFTNSNVNPNLHGTLIRREILSEFNEFKYFWGDMDLLYRIAAGHPVVLSSEECLISTTHNIDKGRKTIIDHAWMVPETVMEGLKPVMSEKDYTKLDAIVEKKIQSSLYLLGIELIYENDFAGAIVGAKKLRNKYHNYLPSLTLELLVLIFRIFPFILNFLRSTRDLRPYFKGQQDQPSVLSYSEIMDIYYNKRY